MKIVLPLLVFFLAPFNCFADENSEKKWSILGGWGDRIFSIFGDAIENQNKQEQFILNELSKSDGKLTIDEIKKLEKHRLEMTVKENEEALKMLNKMNMLNKFENLKTKLKNAETIENVEKNWHAEKRENVNKA